MPACQNSDRAPANLWTARLTPVIYSKQVVLFRFLLPWTDSGWLVWNGCCFERFVLSCSSWIDSGFGKLFLFASSLADPDWLFLIVLGVFFSVVFCICISDSNKPLLDRFKLGSAGLFWQSLSNFDCLSLIPVSNSMDRVEPVFQCFCFCHVCLQF